MGELSTQQEAKPSSSWVAIKAQHSTARVSRGRGVWHLQSLQIFFIYSSTVRQKYSKDEVELFGLANFFNHTHKFCL